MLLSFFLRSYVAPQSVYTKNQTRFRHLCLLFSVMSKCSNFKMIFQPLNILGPSGCLVNMSSRECGKIQRKHNRKSDYFYINIWLLTYL